MLQPLPTNAAGARCQRCGQMLDTAPHRIHTQRGILSDGSPPQVLCKNRALPHGKHACLGAGLRRACGHVTHRKDIFHSGAPKLLVHGEEAGSVCAQNRR